MNKIIKRILKLGLLIVTLAMINGIVFSFLSVDYWQGFLQGFVSVLLGMSILILMIPAWDKFISWYFKD